MLRNRAYDINWENNINIYATFVVKGIKGHTRTGMYDLILHLA